MFRPFPLYSVMDPWSSPRDRTGAAAALAAGQVADATTVASSTCTSHFSFVIVPGREDSVW
ncbi:hypothetical protein DQ384_10950 [Sphaerisporangium album]|uniref:Uncharacterized protein n=1 Tax=Sphaerisporangium album TaxID=509200 RepID=A0A367FNP0_9ACTN|nr:hypothetical protein DQ384_10950 [Sphaerisporangium album]